jgi:hypothetical protein
MTAITFDTLKFVEKLEAAGVPRAQAAAMAAAQQDALSQALDTTLATKGDIARLESGLDRLDTRLDKLDTKLDHLEQRLTIKLGAFMVLAVGVLIAVLKAQL